MRASPLVLVTSTTEVIGGCSRVTVNEAYTSAVADAGLIPVVLPPVSAAVATQALSGVAGLVLTGGEDIDPRHYHEHPHSTTGTAHAARDACEIALVRAAHERRIPTLAICRGPHILNVALGGSLIQDIPSAHPRGTGRVHSVAIDADSRLSSIVGETSLRVSSSHHQAIDRVAPGVRVVGTSPDGIIEAIESGDPSWWMIGVQWHAEDLTATDEDWDRRLFAGFAERLHG
jgi:putative glutamine amidotransferase